MYVFHQKCFYLMMQNICWVSTFPIIQSFEQFFCITWVFVSNVLLHDPYTSIPYAILEYTNE